MVRVPDSLRLSVPVARFAAMCHPSQEKADRARREKEMKHEQEAWRSAGRKDIISADNEMLKKYEQASLQEAKIKSEQARVVSLCTGTRSQSSPRAT